MNLKSIKNIAHKAKKEFNVSHLFCLSVGAMIPIYADVLFLHGFDSSTVSAIMDTVMAAAAISAALSVRNWLTDRMKNKGFEQADLCVKQLSILKHQAKTVCGITKAMFEQSKDIDNAHEDEWFMNNTEKTRLSMIELEHQFSELTLHLDLLNLWNIKVNPTACEDLDTYLTSLHDFIKLTDKAVTILQACSKTERNHYWDKNKVNYKRSFDNITKLHQPITIPFDNLFKYIN
ncbi:hypothetical protein [Pseudescherichia sp.]|uniref:hypothetical protein n=1 Tax=Pseudescherichia sp. TaxID=2055881 RepID=UPI0028A06873|nr:hypothetical protein [Pseudescherichia sp.]